MSEATQSAETSLANGNRLRSAKDGGTPEITRRNHELQQTHLQLGIWRVYPWWSRLRWDGTPIAVVIHTPYLFCLVLSPSLHRFPRLCIEMSSGGKEAATPRLAKPHRWQRSHWPIAAGDAAPRWSYSWDNTTKSWITVKPSPAWNFSRWEILRKRTDFLDGGWSTLHCDFCWWTKSYPKKMLCSIRLEKSLEKGSRTIFLTPDIHACVLERMRTWKKMRWWAQPTTPNNAKSSSAENRPRNGALSMRSTCAKIESDKPVISTKWQLHECMVV